ncbi:hypothetical protein BN6_42370 [Saccharothrix espanaensis DSM 44229]|uniref:LysR substrate-binding domain-containing protein n=1 Tax=Saccharothrix espanaensis (strain ATCC 51144 / DSM 44229 / JCM 9112 / NBRC 15066 / NRRL 15764) TaxID=1179773 RepID=K0K4S1_SACES|nr:hypothetical protein BN6_42370 [Saccharothrix espanaensis DSM 44229]
MASLAPAEHKLTRRVSAVLPGRLVPTALPGEPPSPLSDAARVLGLHLLEIPFPLPPLTIGMAWHLRHTADGGHQWLRAAVRRVLRPAREDQPTRI